MTMSHQREARISYEASRRSHCKDHAFTKLHFQLDRLLPSHFVLVDEDEQRVRSIICNFHLHGRKKFSRKKCATGYIITRVE